MHELCWFNHSLLPVIEISIHAASSATLYGKGIFTTVAVYDSKPFLWEKHWRRLNSNAASIDLNLSGFSEKAVSEALSETTTANGVSNGRVRVTFLDESGSRIWPLDYPANTNLLIISGQLREVADNLRVTTSPYRVNSRSPLAGVKSCNYLENLMALDEAKYRAFDEGVVLNERGEIASATMANVFWEKDGQLYTPSLKTGCLPGTTREFILESLDCVETECGVDDLHYADEIFLTSAGLGVVQVSEFEGRKMRKKQHPILELLPKRT